MLFTNRFISAVPPGMVIAHPKWLKKLSSAGLSFANMWKLISTTMYNTRTHARAHTHTRARTHTYMRTHTHTRTRARTYTPTRAHARAHTHAHARARTHTHTHARTHTHTHTYTRAYSLQEPRNQNMVNSKRCCTQNALVFHRWWI